LPTSPNAAFALTIFGVLGIYCEFVWPGRIIPGFLGLAAALAGAFCLWRHSPTAAGLGLLGGALILFVLDAAVETFHIAGTLGTVALAAGFWKLFDKPPLISAGLAFSLSLVLGGVTILLNRGARRARRNKRADLTG